MNKKYYKLIMLVISVSIFLASAAIAYANQRAVAESIEIIHIFIDADGNDYPIVTSQAMIQSQTALTGFTSVWADENLPTGYLGARARVYNSNNSLVGQSNWHYSNRTTSEWTVGVATSPSSGSYYSRGQIAAFNGTSYATSETARTPNVNF